MAHGLFIASASGKSPQRSVSRRRTLARSLSTFIARALPSRASYKDTPHNLSDPPEKFAIRSDLQPSYGGLTLAGQELEPNVDEARGLAKVRELMETDKLDY